MPVPEGNLSHPNTALEEKAGKSLSKEDLSAIYRELTSPGYPTAPPNSAVPRKIRLVHSAPKGSRSEVLFDGENEESSKESQKIEENEQNDSKQHSNSQTSHPAYTPVYFQIAKSKDILNSSPKQNSGISKKKSSESPLKESSMEIGSNILNYKPGYSRYPSPKKVKFLETYYNKTKSTEGGTPVTEKTSETDAHSARSGSTKASDGSRRNLSMSHCEAMYLTDLKESRSFLNRTLSKSVHSLNVAPRPVAAFPSKPLKAGSFVLARRKGKGDLDRSVSQVCLNDIKIAPDLSVYSISSIKKSSVDNTDAESVLLSLEDLGLKDNPDNLLPKKPGLETPVPYNSCKTSVVSSDVFGRPESVLATRGTMRPWSGTADELSETRSDISLSTGRTDGQTTARSATTRKSSPIAEETQKSQSSKSPRAPVSTNAFRPSKSVHKINASQAYANYNIKGKGGSNEKHKAIIIDIFKKRGMKAPNLNTSNQPVFTENDKRYMSYAGFREGRKQKKRSRSLGRDENADSKLFQDKVEFKSAYDVSQETYKAHPLAILASRGGRDILFNSRNSYKLSTNNRTDKISERITYASETFPLTKNDIVNTENSNNKQPVKQPTQPTVTFADKQDKKTSSQTSFQKMNKKVAADSTEAMFDASHYVGFQHSKFSKKEKNIKDTRRKQPVNSLNVEYNENLKTKFLKVSVGGVGTGIPSESMDSPRSSELTVS